MSTAASVVTGTGAQTTAATAVVPAAGVGRITQIFKESFSQFPAELETLIMSYFLPKAMFDADPTTDPSCKAACLAAAISFNTGLIFNHPEGKRYWAGTSFYSVSDNDLRSLEENVPTSDLISRFSPVSNALMFAKKNGFPGNENEPLALIQEFSAETMALGRAFSKATAEWMLIGCVPLDLTALEVDDSSSSIGRTTALPYVIGKMSKLEKLTIKLPDLLEFRPSLSQLDKLETLLIPVAINDTAIPSLLALLPQLKSLRRVLITTASGSQTVPPELQQLKNTKPGMLISWNGVVVTEKANTAAATAPMIATTASTSAASAAASTTVKEN